MVWKRSSNRMKPKAKGKSKSSYGLIKKAVNNVLKRQVEIKRVDGIGSMSAAAGSYDIKLLNGINLGTDDFNRAGNEVCNKYIKIKGDITFPDTTNKVRVLVLQDMQTNMAFPLVGELFTFTTQPIVSFLTPDSKKRFKVLRDKVYAGGAGGTVCLPVNWYIPLRDTKTVYSLGTDSIAAIRTGAIYVIVVSDSAISPNPLFNFAHRFAYTDM